MDKKWRRVKIGDLGRVVTGNTPPKNDKSNYGGPYPFIKPTDMTVGHRRCNEWEETYSEKAFQRYHKAYIPPGSTGVVTIGTVGEKLFQANRWCFTNQSVNVVIPKEGQFDPDFVFYLMKVSLPKVENANPGTASGRHHVSKSNFESIGVDVPDFEYQQKIGAILSAYDELIENNLKRIKLLEEKAQLLYESWQGNVADKVPIHDLVSGFINGGWGKEQAEGNYVVEAAVIRGTDIPQCNCGSYAEVPVRFHTKSNWVSRQLTSGDIVMEMSNGNANNIGRSILIDDWTLEVFGGKPICASFCKRISPNQPEFGGYLQRHFIWMKLTGKMDTYVKQAANGINNFDFERMIQTEEVGVPTHEKAAVLIRHLGAINELQSNLRRGVSSLEEARDILLPRLMTGMIDVEELDVELPMTAGS